MVSIFDRPQAVVAQILGAKDALYVGGKNKMTTAYQALQRTKLFDGRTRTYQPISDADEDQQPDVNERIQANAYEQVGLLVGGFRDAAEWGLLRDFANIDPAARADLTIGDAVLIKDVPAPALLALEKVVIDINTALKAIPTLDPAYSWSWHEGAGAWQAAPTTTVRTKKVNKVLTLAQATDKHPAQAQVYTEDVPVGRFTDTQFTTKLPQTAKDALVARGETLLAAIKDAQQRANAQRVTVERRAGPLAEYLLGALAGKDGASAAVVK